MLRKREDTEINNNGVVEPQTYLQIITPYDHYVLGFMVINLHPYSTATSIAYRELISWVDPKGPPFAAWLGCVARAMLVSREDWEYEAAVNGLFWVDGVPGSRPNSTGTIHPITNTIYHIENRVLCIMGLKYFLVGSQCVWAIVIKWAPLWGVYKKKKEKKKVCLLGLVHEEAGYSTALSWCVVISITFHIQFIITLRKNQLQSQKL